MISYRETESLVLSNYNAVLNKVINDYGITEAKIIDMIKSISNDTDLFSTDIKPVNCKTLKTVFP